MAGQPTGEIWVATGRKAVVVDVLLTRMELVARVVAVEFVMVGRRDDGTEMFGGNRGRPEGRKGEAVPVGRVLGREVEFRVGNGMRTEGFAALSD